MNQLDWLESVMWAQHVMKCRVGSCAVCFDAPVYTQPHWTPRSSETTRTRSAVSRSAAPENKYCGVSLLSPAFYWTFTKCILRPPHSTLEGRYRDWGEVYMIHKMCNAHFWIDLHINVRTAKDNTFSSFIFFIEISFFLGFSKISVRYSVSLSRWLDEVSHQVGGLTVKLKVRALEGKYLTNTLPGNPPVAPDAPWPRERDGSFQGTRSKLPSWKMSKYCNLVQRGCRHLEYTNIHLCPVFLSSLSLPFSLPPSLPPSLSLSLSPCLSLYLSLSPCLSLSQSLSMSAN